MKPRSLQAVRGMNDILPEAAAAWTRFERVVAQWLERYGYAWIRTPIVEHTELFIRSIGEVTDVVEKEMYTFVDRLNGESLTLRPEGTASCVRAVIEHGLLHAASQRLAYIGPMFRHERPQKGRYRQFHQVGVEALGWSGPDIDAEHIVMCARLWRDLGITDARLEINTLGDAQARARYRARLIAFLEERRADLDEDAIRRMHSNPLRVLDSKNPRTREAIAAAPRLVDDLDETSLKHFEDLQRLLRGNHIAFEINPRLVRGLDYYNRTVFEWITDRLGAQGTICAGGRYDGLVEQLGGKPAPACGFAMGIERLLELVAESGVQARGEPADAYVVHQGEGTEALAWTVAEELRAANLSVVLHCGGGSFKSQMRRADASGARFAIVVGEQEAAAGQVGVKPLRDPGAQTNASPREALELVRNAVGAGARSVVRSLV